jgi:GAF domain-containing protein
MNGDERREFQWGNFWVLPLYSRRRFPKWIRMNLPPLLGLLGVAKMETKKWKRDQREALWLLADRAALALEDRQLQQRVFRSLADLQPQVEMIQRMRAAGRYDTRASLLNEPVACKKLTLPIG